MKRREIKETFSEGEVKMLGIEADVRRKWYREIHDDSRVVFDTLYDYATKWLEIIKKDDDEGDESCVEPYIKALIKADEALSEFTSKMNGCMVTKMTDCNERLARGKSFMDARKEYTHIVVADAMKDFE